MNIRHLILSFLFLLCCANPVGAQQADSAVVARERGMQFLAKQNYAQAYLAFKYYLEHIPEDEHYTEVVQLTQKKYHEAIAKLERQVDESFDKAKAAQNKGAQKLADSLYSVYMGLCVMPKLQETYAYSVALTQQALTFQRQGKLAESIDYLDKVIAIRRVGEYIDRSSVAETLNLKASALHQLGRFDEAITVCTEAKSIYEKYFGKKHDYYGMTVSNLANYYISRNAPGDRQRAVELGEEAVAVLPKSQTAYAQALNNLVVFYSLSGDMTKAQKYAKSALKVTKKMGKNTVSYASILSNQAIRLANANNYEQATAYAQEAINIFKANGDTTSLNFARLLSNTASFAKHVEKYPEAIALWEQAAPIFERIEDKNGSGYLDCMTEISAAHVKTGNMEQAANINEELQNTAFEMARMGDSHYAQSLTKRAAISANDGNYQQAITQSQQALSIFRFRQDVADEASTLKELSSYLYHTGRVAEAIDTCQLALRLYSTQHGHEEDIALALNSLSIYYYVQGRFDEALATSRQAVQYYEQAGRTETSLFAKVLTNQALYESKQDSIRQAIALSMRADSIQRRILGEIHPDNVMLMFNLANYYVRLGDTNSAQKLYHDAMQMQMRHVRSNFSHLTTRGRELYWGTKSYIFKAAPYLAVLMEKNDSALVDAYDAQLFTKGLLLNSEVDFRNLLSRTASPELQEKYSELEAVHQEIEAAWRKPTEESRKLMSKLTNKANRLERELVRGCKEFGDFTSALNISYRQVMEKLDKDDAAIEFFDVVSPIDGRTYWALVGRHEWTAPHLIRLFTVQDFKDITFDGKPLMEALADSLRIPLVFDDERVGRLVWGNIIPHLQGVRNIWFSPSGLFYQFGIEYLLYGDQRISDRYALHRVSSTKLLVQNENSEDSFEEDSIKAAVFGGLRYDATAEELQVANQSLLDMDVDFDYLSAFNEETEKEMAMVEQVEEGARLRNCRKGADFLPATINEANLIGATLMNREIDTEMYLGNSGTEEAFKRLSGRGITLLHVATHGFSYTEEEIRGQQGAMSYLDVATDETQQADNSLCFSGLLMAGANNVLDPVKRQQPLPAGLENGVLTAREIARLDLRGLDLAVLSACQTGLGELKEDGVFGLQRGFKKAGARTLLMSLWSVEDDATQLMMTTFYDALARKQSRREAFHTAQEAVRNDSRFSSPFFWASFVMLDD